MGAGKTSVARALARRLDWKIEDIDDRIVAHERRDIPTIFRQDGEPYFRSLERQQLIELLAQRGTVVATGGGTAIDPANRELMRRDGVMIWLDVPFATIVQRVPVDGRRPLATDRVEMEQLYNQRLMSYQQAHLRLDAAQHSVEELVDQIVEWLET